MMAQTHKLSLEDFRAHDPEGGRGGRWLCPVPGQCSAHTDPRRHRSVSMDEESGLWNCKRCKAQGQLTERWKPFTPKTREERAAEKRQRERVSLARTLSTFAAPIDSAPSAKASSSEWRWRLGSLKKIQAIAPALRFVEGRGLGSPEALELLTASGVRVASDFARREATEEKKAWSGALAVVFPVRDAKGNLVAGQGRFTKPLENGPKCLTLGDRQAGVFATPGALEALLAGRPVAICEAPLDALSLALAGLPSVALCGSGGVPEWLTRRSFGRRFLLAFDADDAGDEAAEKLAEQLRGLGGFVDRLRPEAGKDFNEALQNGRLETLRALIAREVEGSRVAGEPIGTTPSTSFVTAKNPEKPDAAEKPAPCPVAAANPSDEADVPAQVAENRRISQGEESPNLLATNAQESDLPRDTDPEGWAAWLEYAKATRGRVAPFAEWKKNRHALGLAELGRITEETLAHADERNRAEGWASGLDYLERLPQPLAWPRSHSFVPCCATWLRKAGERRNRLYRLHGPRWEENSAGGRELAAELRQLRAWVRNWQKEQRQSSTPPASGLTTSLPQSLSGSPC